MRRFGACDRWLLRRSCTHPRPPRGDGTDAPALRKAPSGRSTRRAPQVKGATRRPAPGDGVRGCRRCCVQPPSDAVTSRKRGGDRWTSQVAGGDHSPPTTWPIAEPATVPEDAHTAPRSARTVQTTPEMSDSLPHTESDIAGSKARSRSRALCRDHHAPVTEGRRLSFSLCGRQNDVLAWFVTGR